MNNYCYEVYEDKFSIYLCVILKKGIVDECVCIQRIYKETEKSEDGTFESLCSELAENSEAWKNWKHSEMAPGLMFSREIAISYTLIASSTDVKSLISTECAECKIESGEGEKS